MLQIRKISHHAFKKTTELSIVRLISAIGFAGTDTIWALYMNEFGLSDATIGFISAGLVIITLIFSFYSTIILEKISEIKLLIASLLTSASLFIVIGFWNNLWLFLGLSTILIMAQVSRLDSFNILFRDESDDNSLNENEGLMFALSNIGWLTGPLIAGFILTQYGLDAVFISSGLFIYIGTYLLIKLKIKPVIKKRKKLDTNIVSNIKQYLTSKKLMLPYFMAAGIEIWWSLIYIYVPIFIIKNGLNAEVVAIFLGIIIVPLVLFEFEIGKLSHKYGFKKFFFIGYSSLAIFSIIAFYLTEIHLILIILGIASIAMAFLEPLQDSFFFKQVTSLEEEKYYPIYATAAYSGSFIGKFAIASFLLFLPENFAYLVISFFMGILAIVSLKIN